MSKAAAGLASIMKKLRTSRLSPGRSRYRIEG
jgi:hypothetical protein